jgi:nucleotide-binding universal stress UspA family protein
MRILIALDRTEYAEIVAEHGFNEAARTGADEIHTLTVVDRDEAIGPALDWQSEATHDLIDTFQLAERTIVHHAVVGHPADSIARACPQLQPDVIVIGRFRHPQIADYVLDHVRCPVLVVGIRGAELAPQCPQCSEVRRASNGEQLLCDEHRDGGTRGLPASVLAEASHFWG